MAGIVDEATKYTRTIIVKSSVKSRPVAARIRADRLRFSVTGVSPNLQGMVDSLNLKV